MSDKLIINTSGEEKALIPDKWVLGTGLSTDSLYIMHANAPLLIIKYEATSVDGRNEPCVVYANGEMNPESLNRLFAEAWQLLEHYKDRVNKEGT